MLLLFLKPSLYDSLTGQPSSQFFLTFLPIEELGYFLAILQNGQIALHAAISCFFIVYPLNRLLSLFYPDGFGSRGVNKKMHSPSLLGIFLICSTLR